MTSWQRIADVLRERYVTDVLIPGRIDRDGTIPRFAPQPLVVFVLLDDGALRLESVGGFGQLEVRVVNSVTLDGVELFAAIEEQEEDELALASQSEQLFGDSWDRLCTTVRPVTDADSRPEEGVVKCLALELESRYWLFFDPTWPFGIRVGNAEDIRRWESEYGGQTGTADGLLRDIDALLAGLLPTTGPTTSEGDPVTGEWTATRGEGFVIAPLLVGRALTGVYAPEWNKAEEAAETQLASLVGELDARYGPHRQVGMREPLFRHIAGTPMPALFQALCDEDLLGDLTVWGPIPTRWLAVSLNQSDGDAPMILCAVVADHPVTEVLPDPTQPGLDG
ncbi:hypothetical protein ABZT04_06625 [Streptomyces sp. NPDC005492]|uniref:hypothetical protein n=1 Tax=Streptomyces sp. NPDC005492 TaxID=3156883 RepID=UPI0033ABFB0F